MSTLALCIPAYNATKYLPQLLTSAQHQIIPFDEILVYNDCSTDATAAVAEKYGAKVVTGDINRGCSWGKNQLAAITSCEWIHFHDADDDLMPQFTQLAHKWMSNANCPDIVLFNYEYRDYDSNKLLSLRKFDGNLLEQAPVAYAIANQINPFCGLYNKKRFLEAGGYDIDPYILYSEDSAFHIKMALAGLTFGVEDQISIINYRTQSSMTTSDVRKGETCEYHVFEKAALKTGIAYADIIAHKLWHLAGRYAASNNWPYVKKSLRLSKQLGYKYSPVEHNFFALLSYINPFGYIWLREKAIRLFKPHLRKN